MNKKSRKVAILDRDGVLNENRGYVGHLDKFKWIKGAKSAIKFLKKENFYVAVITNQSGIARNYFKVKDAKNLHNFMQNDLKKINTKIDVFYFSPYHIDGVIQRYKKKSSCRKPGIGMFKKLQEKIAINKNPHKSEDCNVIAKGFEPLTVCLEGRCSIQLSYATQSFN